MKTTAALPMFTALLFAVSAVLLPAQAEAQKSERQRVVFQVSDNDPAKWNLALNNARNVQADLGKDNVDVEIVAYGPGLNMLNADSKVAPRLAQALEGSIGLMPSENTMRYT
jgi:intracellular sulfur oxidation DsrE/DsrF family protein